MNPLFPERVYRREWADQERRRLGNCDPGLLERCVVALTLLGHLAESGLPFLFKGGTSLLLHLESVRRLSIDIDIVCRASDSELDRVVREIGGQPPFLGFESDVRGTAGGREQLPQRRHFKLWFASDRATGGRAYVLLDVVQEADWKHDTVQLPIRTSFLEPEREVCVRLPTLEALLGDKLTAFAPTTTGVRLRRPDGEEGELMQVAKQLFDIGVLFERAMDFEAIRRTYEGVQAQESGYRQHRHDRNASLDDTLRASLGLAGTRVKKAPKTLFQDTPLLLKGFAKLKGHLTQDRIDDRALHTFAARAGVLAAHLRAGRSLDLASARYQHSATQIEALRHASLRDHPHAWLDGIKPIHPEAFHYWLLSMNVLEKIG